MTGEGDCVIPAAFEYLAPSSVPEAVSLLQQHGYDAKIIAGGQSLIPMMRFRVLQPKVLIDIGRIPGLDALREEDGYLRIGALVRSKTIETAEMIAERYPLLSATGKVVADPIVRNRGTVAGSLVHADPAGDWAAACMAARAQVVATGPNGERVIEIDEFLRDTFTTALQDGEMVTEVRIPTPGPRSGGHYLKIERKVGDFATVAVGVQITLGADGRCTQAGIGLCAVGPITLRAKAAEETLVGQPLTDELIRKAAEAAAAESQPGSDTRGPAEYKRDMVRVLTQRALQKAAQQASAQ